MRLRQLLAIVVVCKVFACVVGEPITDEEKSKKHLDLAQHLDLNLGDKLEQVIHNPNVKTGIKKIGQILFPWHQQGQQGSDQQSKVLESKDDKTARPAKGPPPKPAALNFKGGCVDKPPTPANANIKCSANTGCEVKCLDEFEFPDKTLKMNIRCEDGSWKVSGWDRMPDCEPICMPPCKNLGFCLSPNVCQCPDGFEGPQCEVAKAKPCLDKPPTPLNSRVVCNEKECIATCNKGFAFPVSGNKKLTLHCDAGTWVQRDQQSQQQQPKQPGKKVPDCQPVCDPVCQNGGRCLPNNICECPQEFRGPQCAYPVENCAVERLGFNGGYNCSGGLNSFSCTLTCGVNGVFEFPPAPLYTCEYAAAKYMPEPVPNCIFESDQVQYVSSNSTTKSEMLIESGSELEWNQQHSAKGGQEWSWISGGKGHHGFVAKEDYERYFQRFFSGGADGEYNLIIPEYSLLRETAPRPGTCVAWGGVHMKTFDGKVYSFQSDCSYVLLRDAVSSTFSVVYTTKGECRRDMPCKRSITVYVEDFTYELDTNENGLPYMRKGEQSVVIPSAIDGLLLERVSNFVVLRAEGLGFTIKWDTKSTVMLDVNEALWNRTVGLCGRINGFWMDDFENRDGSRSPNLLGFINSWEAEGFTDKCASSPNEKHACKWDSTQHQSVSEEATKMCDRLRYDSKFEQCRRVVDPQSYYETCRWDYCQCANEQRESCACKALENYFHECLRQGVQLPQGWRDASLCPMHCNNSRVYMMCGPVADETCSDPVSDSVPTADFCVEGCYCPNDYALHEGQCVPRSQCPCTLHQKTYQPGEQVPNDCNTCTCVAGKWQCTEVRCGVRCAVLGDPHYTTFDGHHYDFMGKCSYYLMKGANYSIEAENVPCTGAISEAMNFPVNTLAGVPSCTKTVTIRSGNDVVKLKQNRDALVNGEELAVLPIWIDGLYIRHASSVFLSVELPNGLELWWDGYSRVYIDAPPTFFGNTQGLCGTFNENQRDDLTTPEGAVEQSVAAFANGWKTSEACQDASLSQDQSQHPCETNGHNKAKAEKHCAKIRGAPFQACHHLVNPEQFYLDCLYDVCACQGVKLSDCLCPAIASYAKECALKGAIVDWIPDVRECGVHCKGGQTYQVCGNSCTRTCYDIAQYPKCRRKCVEGCNCPEGQALDPFGQCIPIHQCPCLHKGVEYSPGYKELRPGSRSPDVCTCISARWSCRTATVDEQETLSNSSTAQLQCRTSYNEEFTSCEPEVQLTCKTLDTVSIKKPTECRPGCQCKKGYVFDHTTKKCIKPSQCPCHHGGRSYSEGNLISQDCNTCTCRSGKWECTKHQCPGMCTNWGESHFKTFDGKAYSFHGNCDYMLAKGAGAEPTEKFQVSIQSVPCGSSGVACSKAVTIRLGAAEGSAEETIMLTRHKTIPVGKFSKRMTVRTAGLFVFIEVVDLGLVLQWDRGTRVYLRLDSKWKGRVRGLCGNFNDNALDDFQPPSGGMVEGDVKTFGDSWRLQQYCPESVDHIDTCTIHPHRKVWSVMKCSVLKSEVFEKCHAHVPVDYFVERCVLDSCGCDMGGDCECLCTSLAAYAHECNIHGVPIKWRTQELCPLQCNEECSTYTPCMPTCPAVSCDSPFGDSALCTSDACVEGCQPRTCPQGQIYRSSQNVSAGCVSMAECRSAICMELDGVMYAEGQIMEKDACHACFCSKGKKVCQGQPCASFITSTTPAVQPSVSRLPPARSTTPPSPIGGTSTCRTGWSDWFNTHHPKPGGDGYDRENLPDQLHLGLTNAAVCDVQQMVAIECRTAQSQTSHKKTGDTVNCSVSSGGLECVPGGIKGRNICFDYEIRVLCDCSLLAKESEITTRISKPTTTTTTQAPIEAIYGVTTVEFHVTDGSSLTRTVHSGAKCEDGWTPWMNEHRPDGRGEYELTRALRKKHAFCAANQITSVQCRNAQSKAESTGPSCTKDGYRCRSDIYCPDHEIRFLCQCRCQDPLKIDQLTASSFKDASSRPTEGRLSGAGAWSPAVGTQMPNEFLQLDLGSVKQVTGIKLQGHPQRKEWVKLFALQHSVDDAGWSAITDEDTVDPSLFQANEDNQSVRRVLFAQSIKARYVRIVPMDYHQAISLKVELVGCETDDHQTEVVQPPVECKQSGWTGWMSSHVPGPGDWNERETFKALRVRHSFCADGFINQIRCRVAGSHIEHQQSGQRGLQCDLNNGFYCDNSLQAPGTCLDYEMQLYCNCPRPSVSPDSNKERCDPARPNSPDATSCHVFYQCVDRLNGVEQVKKTCNPPTMYHPVTMVCGWPEEVMKVRPECGSTAAPTSTASPVLVRSTPAQKGDRCDPARPNSPHPTSCYLFYQCVDRLHGVEQVEKTCNPPTMYHPVTMVCDWPEAVIQLRPECGLSRPTTTAAPATTSTTGTEICEDSWTEWFNVSSPSEGGGDFELYDFIVTQFPICPKSQIKDVECAYLAKEVGTKKGVSPTYKRTDYKSSPDKNVKCRASHGLTCYNANQDSGLCQDYTVRFLCGCHDVIDEATTTSSASVGTVSTTPTVEPLCPSGFRWSSCAHRCDQLCLAFDAVLKQRGYCPTSQGCAPGCLRVGNQSCPPGSFWRDEHTCVSIHDCNCRTPSGETIAPGAVVSSEEDCSVCQCLDNEYICDTSSCSYRWSTVGVDVSRNLSVVTKPPKFGPTKSPVSCSAWSDWINDDRSPTDGDRESKTVEELRRSGFCLNGRISEIECRDVRFDRPHTESRDRDLVCSLEYGFSCLTSRQSKGGKCKDYKIRYYCECTSGAVTTTPIMIWTTPSKAVEQCHPEQLVPLLSDTNAVPDSAFTATSSAGAQLGPHRARMPRSVQSSWVSGVNDLDQFIQVDLGRVTQVYGFDVTGNPAAKEYVTSLLILYSKDNQRFSYVNDNKGKMQVFRGPLKHSDRQRNVFDSPVEARYVRLEPQTWKKAIAMQFELLGCDLTRTVVTTPRSTVPVPGDACTDRMGVANGSIDDLQISFSSVDGKSNGIRLNGASFWRPSISSRQEHVTVDLLEPHNLSGVLIQGFGEAWVEAFAVRYSTDGETWNTVVNDDGSKHVFPANVDGKTAHTITFERMINARFLRIVPWQWHNEVHLRMEILGCYHPVTAPRPTPTTVAPTTTPMPSYCHPCPNIPQELLNMKQCACPPNQWWNGTGCVHPSQCPCVDGRNKYSVGSAFQPHDNCSQCVCRLGGISECRSQSCPPCEEGFYSYVSKHPLCQCSCKPCEAGTRLCQSNNVCLNETLWCNGVEDCPDDEINCMITTTPKAAVDCPLVVCAEGYNVENTGLVSSDDCPIFNCVAGLILPPGVPCPQPECPHGYTLITEETPDFDYDQVHQGQQQHHSLHYDQTHQQSSQGSQQYQGQQGEACPPYKCAPPPETSTPRQPPVPSDLTREDRCTVTGRLFRTFDGSEFSYDICHHILLREREHGTWSITVHKNCSDESGCSRSLRIHHRDAVVELLPKLRVSLDNLEYSLFQAEQVVHRRKGFKLRRVADSIVFNSAEFGFWVVWDVNQNFKIGVTSHLLKIIDGLCGLYNGDQNDDQSYTPSGERVYLTSDFGDSWAINSDIPSECTSVQCPISTQTHAWDKCSFLRKEPFTRCHGPDDAAIDRAVFRCVEHICDCVDLAVSRDVWISRSTAIEQCTCHTMSVMAVECHDDNPSVDLAGWRSKNNCPVSCTDERSVYHECNSKPSCEPTCNNRKNVNLVCEDVPDLCYPGCVCPDGLVRRQSDNKCVEPAECRDCSCQGFGDPHYVSFDQKNFTFAGNCTYIAARDKILPSDSKTDHDFQVLVTNKKCEDDMKQVCTYGVTILYQEHVIEMRRSASSSSLAAYLDSEPIEKFPLHLPWMRMEKLPGEELTTLLLAIEVEVSYFLRHYAFKVRVPSQLYLNKTEGLCGNCNGDSSDDMCMANGEITDNTGSFGQSWLAKKVSKNAISSVAEGRCQIVESEECPPMNPDTDPCLKLFENDAFKMCHPLVDPLPYITACQFDVCDAQDPSSVACSSLEAYARECATFQICLPWRTPELCPVECPSGMEFRQCGSGCLTSCEQVSRDFKQDTNPVCMMSPADGCYCPDNQAFNQELGQCVPLDRCHPCDTEGHYRGDEWSDDACTSCRCHLESGSVRCEKKECVLEDCMLGEIRKVVDAAEGECCPSVLCLVSENLVSNHSCPQFPKPTCGKDQLLVFQDVNGCLRQVCECIPLSECPRMDSPISFRSGEKYIVNDSGCCPFMDRVCVANECPPKPECPTFFDVEIAPGTEELCCPEYRCLPPKDVCIYEHMDGDDGRQVSRDRPAHQELHYADHVQLELPVRRRRSIALPEVTTVKRYEVNATWSDGPCVTCVCEPNPHSTVPKFTCTTKQCPETVDDDYFIATEVIPNECCPRIVRKACQQDTRVYQAEEKWPAPGGDPCKSYLCQGLPDGTVSKQLLIESCTVTCPRGWEYRIDNSTECCGKCYQVACVTHDGVGHPLGQSWKTDSCTTSVCVERDDVVQIESVRESCEQIGDEERDLFHFEAAEDDGRCCPVYRKSGCKSNGVVYKPNDTWTLSDPCVSYKCAVEGEGQLTHQKIIQSCTSHCKEGYEYVPPAAGSSECCGNCAQVACIMEGQSIKIGESLNPDPCTTITCTGSDGEAHLTKSVTQCPSIDCPEEHFFTAQGECCASCNASSAQKCQPEVMAPDKTIGYVVHSSAIHGRCSNLGPIDGLAECEGFCESKTIHEHDSVDPISKCDCCQARETTELRTELTCADGTTLDRIINIPKSCSCTPCVSSITDNFEDAEKFVQKVDHVSQPYRRGRGDLGILPRSGRISS